MNNNVAIIDYHMGNLFSVEQACRNVGLNPIITSKQTEIENSDAVILPGVGAFPEAMNNLNKLNLIETLKKILENEKPFMGICLGFQLLFSGSEEFGNTKGLNVFPGQVKKFPTVSSTKSKIKVPQIGWNQIHPYNSQKWKRSLLNGINNNEFMYFVHSYFVETEDDSITLTYTEYEGIKYCSSIEKDNVFASQFHPEKSAYEGIKIYNNFANSINQKD
ncbi:MAG: imidazole glycerol phosphate synthase subunit HisH [Bacteroidetes bacterium]|nr:imidazole glycerol phosphate synthase subunit HisH [Bacteroidota bacterium]